MTYRFVSSLKKPKDELISVLILSSIPQYRMTTIPCISLVYVNRYKTVLDFQNDAINIAFPNNEIVLTTGHNGKEVIKKKPKNIRVVENLNYTSYSQSEELRIGINNITNDNVIIVNGNVVFNSEFISQVKKNHSTTLVEKCTILNSDRLGITCNNSKVENISYGLYNKWIPMIYLTGKELEYMRHIVNKQSNKNLCFFECINSIVQKHGIVYTHTHNMGFYKEIQSQKSISNDNSN